MNKNITKLDVNDLKDIKAGGDPYVCLSCSYRPICLLLPPPVDGSCPL